MPAEMQTGTPRNPRDEACWTRVGSDGNRTCELLPLVGHCRSCTTFSEAGRELFQREPPADYLQAWTQELARTEPAAEAGTFPVIVFRSGEEWLALSAQVVQEVVDDRRIHRVPHRSDRQFLGLANIRGELELCVALEELLNIQAAAPAPAERLSQNVAQPPSAVQNSPHGRGRLCYETGYGIGSESRTASPARFLLVTEYGGNRWVFPVDEVAGVCRMPASALSDLPSTAQRNVHRYTRAILTDRGRNIGLLDEERLFDALERTIG